MRLAGEDVAGGFVGVGEGVADGHGDGRWTDEQVEYARAFNRRLLTDEQLVGTILPVGDDVRHWHASPRAAVEFLLRAAELDLSLLGSRRSLNLPGVSVTVGEQIEALRAIAGDKTVALIRREPDETIVRIVAGWARDFDPARAKSLGFQADANFSAIIKAHTEDELNG